MIPSTHDEYLTHLKCQLLRYQDDADFQSALEQYASDLATLTDLSLDPLRDDLAALYCPTGQGGPKDPCGMLRSLLLMTLERESSPDRWARRLKRERVLAVLAGFTPGQTPCATTHRDFITRYADGPYALRKKQDRTLSQTLTGRHDRDLHDMTKARNAEADAEHTTQSELLCRRLLDQADTPRDPNALQTRLSDLFVHLALTPSLAAGLFSDPKHLTGSIDGTPLATAASPDGKKTCDCPPGSKCEHPRSYTSGTAQWCWHPHRGWVFGDESSTLSTHVNGHDAPLMTTLGTGNESDFTCSPRTLDEFLKMTREHDLPFHLDILAGDGHHDTRPFYQYLKQKGIRPVIPLKGTDEATKDEAKTPPSHPHFSGFDDVTFDPDGTPLCPGGCRMAHTSYSARKDTHFFSCPHKRRQRDNAYRFNAEACPLGTDCCPENKGGKGLYIPSATNERYFPEIPRNSRRFKELYAERTGVERSNAVEDSYHLDRCTRHAVYGLIRLTLVNVAKHARLRWLDRTKTETTHTLFLQERERILATPETVIWPK